MDDIYSYVIHGWPLRSAVLNLWVATPTGVAWRFYRGRLRLSEIWLFKKTGFFNRVMQPMLIAQFWFKCLQSYLIFSEGVLRFLIPFSTTYVCETVFSSLLVIKSKYRSRLNAEIGLGCVLQRLSPEFLIWCEWSNHRLLTDNLAILFWNCNIQILN